MNYSSPCSLSRQILAFPVTIATSGGWPSRARAVARPRGAPIMPSGGGKAPRPCCTRRSRVDFQVKPSAKWTREAQSFITQMYLTVNYAPWKAAGDFGKFVQLLMFSESAVSSFQFTIAILCSVLPVCLKTA